jgi:putative nucleotidyltransferase with HDIG domain/PAS domain S-box-containing protein
VKSKLALNILLFGWVLFLSYIIYEIREYGVNVTDHFFSMDRPADTIFHILIFSVPVGSSITAYLVNERKKMLEQVSRSERRLYSMLQEWRVTLDSMPYGIMLLDKNMTIVRANKYIADMAGMDIKKLLGNKCHEVIHRRSSCIRECPAHAGTMPDEPASFEFYDQSRNRFFLSSITPIRDDSGKIIAYSHPLIDVTAMKEKEKKLEDARDAFFNMLKDLDTANKEMKGIYKGLLATFSNIIDAKSHWTRGHSVNTTAYAIKIARKMGLPASEIDKLRTAALLHDIGKISTYDEILDKPGNLTDQERELIRQHPTKAEEILRPIRGLADILPVIRAHHERVDGTGYPDGLKREEIPLLARILCVADAYDAMMSDRPYRTGRSREYAIEEMKRCAGAHFDTHVVDRFLEVLQEEGLIHA